MQRVDPNAVELTGASVFIESAVCDESCANSIYVLWAVEVRCDGVLWCAEADNPALVLRDRRTLARLWSWRPRAGPGMPAGEPACMSYVASTRTVWVGWTNGAIRVFDVSTRKQLRSIQNVGGSAHAAVTAMCVGNSAERRDEIYCGTSDGHFAQFDAHLGVQIALAEVYKNAILRIGKLGLLCVCIASDRVVLVLKQEETTWQRVLKMRDDEAPATLSLTDLFDAAMKRFTAQIQGNYIGPRRQRSKVLRSLAAAAGDEPAGNAMPSNLEVRRDISAPELTPHPSVQRNHPACGVSEVELEDETTVILFDEKQSGVTVGTPRVTKRKPVHSPTPIRSSVAHRDPPGTYFVHRAISRPSAPLVEPHTAQVHSKVDSPAYQAASVLGRMCEQALRRRYFAKLREKVLSYHAILIQVPEETSEAFRGVIMLPATVIAEAPESMAAELLSMCKRRSIHIWVTCNSGTDSCLSVLQARDGSHGAIHLVVVRPSWNSMQNAIGVARRVLIPGIEETGMTGSLLAVECHPGDFLSYRYSPLCGKLYLPDASAMKLLIMLLESLRESKRNSKIDWVSSLGEHVQAPKDLSRRRSACSAEVLSYCLVTTCVGDRFAKLPSLKIV